MKTITLPAGTLHLDIDDISHYMALSLWPLRDDDSPGDGLDYGFCCATLKAELAQAVESKELPVKDPLTRGPHAHPYGANVLYALVRVDDLRKYVADRGFLVEVAEREAPVQITDTPVVTEDELSESMSPEFEKWRSRWRAVSFDENRVEDAINELGRFIACGYSEIAIRDQKSGLLREELAQIAERKNWLALQMGDDALHKAERRFTLEEMAESRQPLNAVEIVRRGADIVLANQEIDSLISNCQVTKTGVLTDQTEVWAHVPYGDSHLAEKTAPITPVVHAPAQTSIRAPRSRKPSWSIVAMPYMRQIYCEGNFKSAVAFYKALLNRADTPNSPFIKLKGELYCSEAGTTVAEGTVGTKWAEIRGK